MWTPQCSRTRRVDATAPEPVQELTTSGDLVTEDGVRSSEQISGFAPTDSGEDRRDETGPPEAVDDPPLTRAWRRTISALPPYQRAWLQASRPLTLHGSTLIVAVAADFTRDQLESRLREQVERALEQVSLLVHVTPVDILQESLYINSCRVSTGKSAPPCTAGWASGQENRVTSPR